MSLARALEFIVQVRADKTLYLRVQTLQDELTLDGLVRLGAERGLDFTASELQTAFKHDWMMRRLRFNER